MNVQIYSYDSSDDLVTPFNNDELLLDEQEDEMCNSIDYRLLGGEVKGTSKYKQIPDSNADTSVYSSTKSPLKMVFKKKSGTMTTVTPSVTPEPISSANTFKSSRKESISKDLGKPAESFASISQVILNLTGMPTHSFLRIF